MFRKTSRGLSNKVIYTLNINYPESITDLTYPLIEDYARKIDADFVIIEDRKFPEWPVVYEKLQIYERAQEEEREWVHFIDSDVLVNPDLPDLTVYMRKDTIAHFGNDLAGNRFKYDRFFLRDNRHIGSCNWFTIASDWCIDLWKPLDDLTFKEALKNINVVIPEALHRVPAAHLIDDYVLSRNIAKYGLKFTTVKEILDSVDGNNPGRKNYLFHEYLASTQKKENLLRERLRDWGMVPEYEVVQICREL